MVLSKYPTCNGDHVISLYMPALTDHLPSGIKDSLPEVKDAVLDMGGKKNATCRFLKRNSADKVCTSDNIIACRGVLQVPRAKEFPKHLFQILDKCENGCTQSAYSSIDVYIFAASMLSTSC